MGNLSIRWGQILRCGAVLALSGLLGTHTAGAQPAAAPADIATDEEAGEQGDDSNDVVVTGRRQASAAEVSRFVDAIVAETGNDRIARWADRICVNVEGVGETHQNYFVERITAVARQLNLQIAPHRGCEPSAYVVFTHDPGELLVRLEQERPAFFGSIPRSEREAFAASMAPVRWLSLAQIRGANGETPFSFYVDPKTGGVERPVPGVRGVGSRLATGTRMDLQSLLVVVDVSKLRGVSNRSLAAYLAMVVFGNIRQQHKEIGAPSILGLFDEDREAGVITNDMTPWDESYLRSLYAGNWNMPSTRRIGLIRASMRRELNGGRERP